MAKTKRTTRDPWKSKVWYNARAPNEFNNAIIGKIPASDPALLPGRVIETSIAELGGDGERDFRRQKQKIRFRITKVKGSEAETEFIGHGITRDYERSMGKRGSGKFYGNYLVDTEDGRKAKVKVMGVSVRKLTRQQRAAISAKAEEILKEAAGRKSLSDFIQSLLFGKLGSRIFASASKVHPMKFIVVSKTEVVG